MTDVELSHVVEFGDVLNVAIVQTVTGMEFQPSIHDPGGGVYQCSKLPRSRRALNSVRVSACVQLDRVDVHVDRGLDLIRFGIKEESDFHAVIPAPLHGLGDPGLLADHVKATLSGELLAPLWNECDLIWANNQRQLHHCGLGCELEVEPDLHSLAEEPHVAILDVAAILTEVDGDPVGPAKLGHGRRPDWVRLVSPASLAKRRDMIDVDAQARSTRGPHTRGPHI
jgi:hypothetical protein